MEQQDEVRVAWGTGIAGHVAESGEPVNIPDAYQVCYMPHAYTHIYTSIELVHIQLHLILFRRMHDSIERLIYKRDIEQKLYCVCQSKMLLVMWSVLRKL